MRALSAFTACVLALVAACTRAEAAEPEPAAPATATVAPKPPVDELWQTVAQRIGVDEAALRACKQTSECTSLPHFTTCCAHVAVAKAHAVTVTKHRAKLADLQSDAQRSACAVTECAKATSPVACVQGWCVLDPYRDEWTKVAAVVGTTPEALRLCTSNDECTLTRNPARCCNTVALAKRALPKVQALGDTLMTKHERERCAIKKCGAESWTAICNEGLCQLDFAP